jgi:hypothetical protein
LTKDNNLAAVEQSGKKQQGESPENVRFAHGGCDAYI